MKLSTTMMINEKLLPSGKRAFTLAEVLITLSILGVVAAMTIPTLVNRQSDIAAQTRLKKAISNYHDLVEIHMLETGSNDARALFTANCDNAQEYFKITNRNGCTIDTADGARWYIQQNSGNAVVLDSTTATPRYGVIMWNGNGFVNSDQCNNNGNNAETCGTTVVAVPTAPEGVAPVNGYFNAKEFLANTGAEMKTKNRAASGNDRGFAAAITGAAGNDNKVDTTSGIKATLTKAAN